jgi:filamentous hemagglutinin family protein
MHTRPPLLSPLALAVACALGPAPLMANPSGPQVVSGSVSINAAPGVTTINQSSHRAIVNWQSFSIQPGETTRFNQPSSSAAILNRVVGGNPSQLLGNLSANGQVYLINPNGVLVGAGATIHTGAFVASTRDVSNIQFMQGGPLDFTGTSGAAITNLGSIHAAQGDVQLIAFTVDNQGNLGAPRGTAGLSSGTHVLFAPADSQRILVRPEAVNSGGSVANSGVISAAQVELKAAGGNPYALAVNAGGSISAISIDNVGGRIMLNARAGTTQVDGTLAARDGGRIEVTGQHVRLTGQASLDVSDAGGGAISVGGGYQGKDAQLQNAESLTVAAGARLNADAGALGDGGRIILWSDGHTAYQGHLSARGGSAGGGGGFAEISGKNTLEYRGSVDLRAPAGKTGTLLLDPTDITIVSAAATGSLTVSGNTSTITDADLAAALATANVTISTSSAGGGSGDITVSAVTDTAAASFSGYFFDSSNNTLTLHAERDIIVNHPMRVFRFAPVSTTAGLTLQAGRNLEVNNTNGNVFLWSNNLTLVADNANNGNGSSTMRLANGVMLFGDNIRLFAPSTDQLTLAPSVTLASFVPNVGLWLGDPGTAAAAIYTRRAGTSSNNPGASSPLVLPPPQITHAALIPVYQRSLDDLIRATGDAELIKQLELFNALRTFVARDGISDGEAREISRVEEALRNRLPNFDPDRQQRINQVSSRNDFELTRWMDTLLWYEQYIFKYGRDEYTLAEIAKLKEQIDIKLAGYDFIEQIQSVNGSDFQRLVGFDSKRMAALFQQLAKPDYPTLRENVTTYIRSTTGDRDYVNNSTDAELRGLLFDQLLRDFDSIIDLIDRKTANQLKDNAKYRAMLDEVDAQLESSGHSSSRKQVVNLAMMWQLPNAQIFSNFYNERLQNIGADLAVFATQRAVMTDLRNRLSATREFLTGQGPKPGSPLLIL